LVTVVLWVAFLLAWCFGVGYSEFPVFICPCCVSFGLCLVLVLSVVGCCRSCCCFCLAIYGGVRLVARCDVVGVIVVNSGVLHLVLLFVVAR